jgi:hypothetical protein
VRGEVLPEQRDMDAPLADCQTRKLPPVFTLTRNRLVQISLVQIGTRGDRSRKSSRFGVTPESTGTA